MANMLKIVRCWLMGLVVVMYSGCVCGDTGSRDVQLNVSVKNAGQPVAGLSFTVHAHDSVGSLRTNAQGVGSTTLNVMQSAVAIEMWPTVIPPSGLRGTALRTAWDEDTSRIGSWTLKRRYVVPLESGVDVYAIDIQVDPAVKVSGRLVRNASPLEPMLAFPGHGNTAASKAYRQPGEFVVGGFARGVPGSIYFMTDDGIITRRDFAAPDNDIDIGDVTIGVPDPAAPKGMVSVELRLEDGQDVSVAPVSGVTFVSADGSGVYTRVAKPSDQTRKRFMLAGVGDQTQLPVGTYFVVPGLFNANAAQVKVIEDLRLGRAVGARGVPSIEVLAGESRSLTINPSVVEAACLAE